MAKRGNPPPLVTTENAVPKRGRGRPRKILPSIPVNPSTLCSKKRGRPRKVDTVSKLSKPTAPSRTAKKVVTTPTLRDLSPAKSTPATFKIPRLPHRSPDTFDKVWDNALTLAGTITDHYAMRRNEQKEALKYALEELDQGDLFVELGMGHGHTASIICYGAKLLGYRYIGIDNFTVEATEETTRNHLDRLNLPYTLQVGNSRNMGFNQTIDILLIDASHDVVAVNEDSQNWLRHIRPGGLVIYHDYSINLTPDNPHWGIKLAVDTYTRTWKTESLIDWLLVRRKPLR